MKEQSRRERLASCCCEGKNPLGPSPLGEALFSLRHFVASSQQEYTVR